MREMRNVVETDQGNILWNPQTTLVYRVDHPQSNRIICRKDGRWSYAIVQELIGERVSGGGFKLAAPDHAQVNWNPGLGQGNGVAGDAILSRRCVLWPREHGNPLLTQVD